MRRIAVIGCCVLSLLAASCNRGEDDPATSPDATATVAVSPTPEPTPCVLGDATTDSKSVANPNAERSTADDIRPNDDGGCPRVVFQFRDQVPNYTIAYADAPFEECGSGEEVETGAWDADAYLSVRMEPAGSGDINTGEPVYKGPNDIAVDGPTLKHLRRICDFEAVYEWVIGVSGKLPFTVDTLDDPARLVIDISES